MVGPDRAAHTPRTTPSEALAALSLGNGLYAASVAYAAASVLGLALPLLFYAWAFCAAWSGFMLDRVKPAVRFAEPSDAISRPGRAAFIRKHAVALRSLMVVVGMVALALGALVHPLAAVATIGAWLGVFVYSAALPARSARSSSAPRRLKNLPIVKNLLVGGAFGVLAVLAVLLEAELVGAERAAGAAFYRNAMAAACIAWLTLLVAADAALCDLGDEPGDLAAGTRTLPVLLGPRATVRIALAVHVAAALLLVSVSLAVGTRSSAVWLWATLPIASAAIAARAAPLRPGGLIDWRLPIVAILVALLV